MRGVRVGSPISDTYLEASAASVPTRCRRQTPTRRRCCPQRCLCPLPLISPKLGSSTRRLHPRLRLPLQLASWSLVCRHPPFTRRGAGVRLSRDTLGVGSPLLAPCAGPGPAGPGGVWGSAPSLVLQPAQNPTQKHLLEHTCQLCLELTPVYLVCRHPQLPLFSFNGSCKTPHIGVSGTLEGLYNSKF